MLVKTQKYVISVYRLTCVNGRRGTSDLSLSIVLGGISFSLWFTIHIFSSRLKLCIFTDLGVSGLRTLCPDMASRRSHECRKKIVHEISQSASQLKILGQKQPALCERNACRRAVIGPGKRVRVAVWGSR